MISSEEYQVLNYKFTELRKQVETMMSHHQQVIRNRESYVKNALLYTE